MRKRLPGVSRTSPKSTVSDPSGFVSTFRIFRVTFVWLRRGDSAGFLFEFTSPNLIRRVRAMGSEIGSPISTALLSGVRE
jgi:hypothetical protein